MRINTKIVFDMETGDVLEREGFDYDGPLALCDRAAQATAGQAGTGALGAGESYTRQAGQVGGYLTPLLESWGSGNAPGYGSDLGYMQGAAQSTAQAAAHQGQQQGLLNAMRTGNVAGVGAQNVASAVGAGQEQTKAVQDILSQNAMLKAQQQQSALGMLGSMYGTDVRAGLQGYGTAAQAAVDQAQAGKSGWFQNLLAGINAMKTPAPQTT